MKAERALALTCCMTFGLLNTAAGQSIGQSPTSQSVDQPMINQPRDESRLQRAIIAIRTESLRSDCSKINPAVRPLPLLASWNAPSRPTLFDAQYQLDQIQRGQYLLPWIAMGKPGAKFDAHVVDAPVRKLAALRLPLSFISTQWESLVPQEIGKLFQAQNKNRPDTNKSDNKHATASTLAPDSPIAAWYAAGLAWGTAPFLRRMQELYPDPPLILFVSNNEQPKQTWREILAAEQQIELGATRRDDIAIRRELGDAWVVRYRQLQQGFRDGLTQDTWKQNARFIGFDAFGTSATGRWPGWIDYSLNVPERIEPWPLAWDGASPAYYTYDWNPSTDYRVWSPQIEAMNWIPMLAEARRLNPCFWFEMSVWDGQQPGRARDKLTYYVSQNQQYNPERYAGMVTFGMWLLRPRVVREFRDPADDPRRFVSYFDALMRSVARVHDNETLARFWRDSRLVANAGTPHPYSANLPPALATAPRWYLLNTKENPPTPWQLESEIAVFSLALEKGIQPKREWLIYAYSPRHQELATSVQIPNGPVVEVVATRHGNYTFAREQPSDIKAPLVEPVAVQPSLHGEN